MIGTDCIGRYKSTYTYIHNHENHSEILKIKSNYQTSMAKTATLKFVDLIYTFHSYFPFLYHCIGPRDILLHKVKRVICVNLQNHIDISWFAYLQIENCKSLLNVVTHAISTQILFKSM